MRIYKMLIIPICLLVGCLHVQLAIASESYTDEFSNGLTECIWTLNTNQPLYSVDDTNGDIRISKLTGGTYAFQVQYVTFRGTIQGDFDVSVEFRDANINRVDGTPANQIQLNAIFGGQLFAVVRDDDVIAGNNHHVYIDPPQDWRGPQGNTATSGTLRITRVGATVTGYFDGSVIHSATYNQAVTTRLWFSLQNNGTVDATSVVFDNFSVTADDITFPQCPGVVSGQLIADCPDSGSGLLGVMVDAFDIGTGDLVRTDTTDANGAYEIAELTAGDYSVSIVTPLGYTVPSEDMLVTVAGGETSTVDFPLACLDSEPNARGNGFWKHQVGVATGGKGKAHIDAAALCEYLDVIESHFNSNAVNQVVIYEPSLSGECADNLEVAKELLNLKGNVGITARAKQQLMGLLMNVAAGFLSLTAQASEDGATVSQAITRCDNLIDNPDGNHELAKDIAEMVNKGELVPAGMIPLGTRNIAYRGGTEITGVGFSLHQNHPNPFSEATAITLTLPVSSDYTLSIYNVVGRLVRQFSATGGAGKTTLVWDGRDDSGARVGSGLYFYRFRAGNHVASKTMILAY